MCQYLLFSRVIQIYIYTHTQICSFFLILFFIVVYNRILNIWGFPGGSVV